MEGTKSRHNREREDSESFLRSNRVVKVRWVRGKKKNIDNFKARFSRNFSPAFVCVKNCVNPAKNI